MKLKHLIIEFSRRRHFFCDAVEVLGVGFNEELVNAVVNGVSSHDESDGWNVQASRVVRVRVTDLDGPQLVAVQLDHASFEFLRDDEFLGNLPWESRVPETLEDLRRRLPLHAVHSAGCGDCPRIREMVEECPDAKEVVGVAVCNVDRRQVLAARLDPSRPGLPPGQS